MVEGLVSEDLGDFLTGDLAAPRGLLTRLFGWNVTLSPKAP